jgi:hypothetical protein
MLEARNYSTRIIANPLVQPSRFAWWLNNDRSASRLILDDETLVADDQITGVLVRSWGWIDPIGWQPNDLAYMQAEVQAALLAWLWSLSCPVVNRYPPAIWYRPNVPLLSWYPLLRSCGLPVLETLVTNVEQEARTFGQESAPERKAGVVYGPLSSNVHYLVTSDEDWNGLAAMQRYTPVSLAYPHGAAQFVCVVGEQVVWEGEPSSEVFNLEQALCRFATVAGLTFVEIALAPTSSGMGVIAVEPHPRLEHFGAAVQKDIVERIVQLLTAKIDDRKGVQRRVS